MSLPGALVNPALRDRDEQASQSAGTKGDVTSSFYELPNEPNAKANCQHGQDPSDMQREEGTGYSDTSYGSDVVTGAGNNWFSTKPATLIWNQSTATLIEMPNTELSEHARANGIRARVLWAPLNIGLERRLQTLLVLCHTLTIAMFLTFFFFTCAIPLFWPLLLPYLIYISLFSTTATSGTLKGRSNFLRSLPIWSIYASYFPARLIRSESLPPTRKYIFGYHPHGIISHGAFAAFATEALGFSKLFPGITNTLLTLDSNFRIPFYREYALAMGLASVSRESCENLLTKGGIDNEGMGRAITIVIGGAQESLDAHPYSMRLVLKRRKGFVKLAVRTGADLVPVLAFGENDLYEQVRSDRHPIIYRLQMLVKRTLGFTIPLFHARGVFNYDVGLMPYRCPLNIVVGRPIPVVQQQNRDEIDDQYISQLHARYVQELRRLWEEWKDVFATRRRSDMEIA